MCQHTIKYVHTNLIAKDWKKLMHFYINVFNCKPNYPERNISGVWLDDITELSGSQITGIHLSLPGYQENGPTLEIFQYQAPNNKQCDLQHLNKPGFGHIAFHVDDVQMVLKNIIQHDGKAHGKIVHTKYLELKKELTITYAKDPEGNFIELQNWVSLD